MQFPTQLNKFLKVDEEGFVVCTGRNMSKQINSHFLNEGMKILHSIINQMGENSAKSQGLKQIITSAIKFNGSDHRIYLKIEGNVAIGFVRTGEKKLFYHDNMGSIKELNPTCVLDIYIHQNYQRAGIGKQVFEKFLKEEQKVPEKLAYDRPSPKLISFLKKHYNLTKFIPQNNNFVIFDRYFGSSSSNQYQGSYSSSGNYGSSSLKKLPSEKQPASDFFKGKQSQKHIPLTTNPMNRFMVMNNELTDKGHDLTKKTNPNKTIDQIGSSSYKQMQSSKNPDLAKVGYGNRKSSMNNVSKTQIADDGIEDSLTKLKKEMQMTNLNGGFRKIDKEELSSNSIKNQCISSFGCPWATQKDLGFRTTSGNYGSHYHKYRK